MAVNKNDDRAASFSRRAFVIGAAQGALLAVLGGRLAWLQVVEGSRYKMLAESNRINLKMLAPIRGEIVDRFGVPLAVSNQNFRVLVVPEQAGDLEEALARLKKFIRIEDRDLQRVLRLAQRSPSFTPLEVTDDLSWDEVATVEVNIIDLPGTSIDMGEVRHYPFGDSTAHVVGYVGVVNERERDAENDPLLRLPGFEIGKSGIERTMDQYLRGKAGRAEMEVNVVGREVRELRSVEAQNGQRVMLSLDAELQRFAQQRMENDRSASAVVMDVHTGAIYALASYPGFDPNDFIGGISHERWEELRADITLPLTNKAVSGQYPPGSTFKMVTALAALEAGIVTEHTGVFCPGHYDFGNGRFHCWKRGGHGTVNVVRALAESCDTYFYKISTELGIRRIAEMARRFGLGELFDEELKEARSGLVPDEAWKRRRFNEGWHPGETIIASIGQGYMLATPLQLAVMTARMANGGRAVEPWLAAYVDERAVPRPAAWDEINIDPQHIEVVLRGMYEVINSPRGTAYGSRITAQGMTMAGKTGTSQVKRITRQERAMGIRNEDLPWHFRHHALFVGYAPVDNPRYACSVVVEHGVGGSRAAAPIGRDLLRMVQERDPAAKSMMSGQAACCGAGRGDHHQHARHHHPGGRTRTGAGAASGNNRGDGPGSNNSAGHSSGNGTGTDNDSGSGGRKQHG